MGALCPKRCTGIIALVFDVIAFAISVGSILKVLGSTSTRTGVKLSKPKLLL
jgi:hypothetical protein|tara:strand:- start:35 stop:190 length:156 start_codon:yes stop_codon:yes gene_type:complete